MDQVVQGLGGDVARHVTLRAECLFHDGFVPLILPTVVSDAGVTSNIFNIRAKLTF